MKSGLSVMYRAISEFVLCSVPLGLEFGLDLVAFESEEAW